MRSAHVVLDDIAVGAWGIMITSRPQGVVLSSGAEHEISGVNKVSKDLYSVSSLMDFATITIFFCALRSSRAKRIVDAVPERSISRVMPGDKR